MEEAIEPRRTALFAAALVLLAFAAHGVSIGNEWIWDDDAYVTHNETLRSPEGLGRIWTDRHATPQYYPLVHTSFWVERRLWGEAPAGYHLDNVLLHALASVLLWRLLVALRMRGAWLGAALFCVHPVTVESVAWVTERKNVLSLALALGSALCWWTARRRPGRLVAAVVLFGGALLAKTVTASLPLVLALLCWWRRRSVSRAEAAALVVQLALGAWAGALTALDEQGSVGAEGARWSQGLIERFLIASRSVVFYVQKLAIPHPLSFNYPRFRLDGSPDEWLFPLILACALAAAWKAGRGALVAVLVYVGVLFPALGFLNVYPHRYSFVADHFQYHAMPALLAPFAGFVVTAFRAGPRRIVGSALVVGGLCLSAVYTTRYRDERTLWLHTLSRNPGSYLAHHNLGRLEAAAGNREEGIRRFLRAAEIDPGVAETANNLATLLAAEGRLGAAEGWARRAIEADPSLAEPHLVLGRIERARGDLAAACRAWERGLELGPVDPAAIVDAVTSLLWIYGTHEEDRHRSAARAEALANRLRASGLARDAAAYDALGVAYAEAGRFSLALEAAEAARAAAASERHRRRIEERLRLYRRGAAYRTADGRPDGS